MRLTEKDRLVFEFIKSRSEDGFVPTIREICEEFGFKSTSTAHRSINSLVEHGLIEKE
ncbi:MAG: helix-turn-helix domain-containing protein, partial [Oscillospiraceae bacterium]